MMLKMAGGNDRLVRRGNITHYGTIAAADGVKLSYWVIGRRRTSAPAGAADQSRGTVVLIHPLLASKLWFLYLGGELADRGYDVVLPDLRAHGESGGKYVTWGCKEKDDIKRIMDRLVKEKTVGDRIFVLGASLGGCVAVQYAAYDKRCRGVVALCPPAGCREVARRILPMPTQAGLDARIACAGRMAGFNPSKASALAAAGELECPLILVHGYMDMIVPYQHSEAILQAAHEPKNLIVVPWADHMSVQVGQDGFLADQVEALAGMGKG
jgi:pimeloyl-ACP methyl ester carboxylesterase